MSASIDCVCGRSGCISILYMIADFHNDYLTEGKEKLLAIAAQAKFMVCALYRGERCFGEIESLLRRFQKEHAQNQFLGLEDAGYAARVGVEILAEYAPVYASLTWNFENELAYPNRLSRLPDGSGLFEAETERGLTETGAAFVEEMERLGMLIDVSHLGDKGVWDVLRLAKGPVIASHSNARALASFPRNLTDDMIRAIAEKGGIIGINYCAAFLEDFCPGEREISRVSRMVEHMKHIRKVGGIGCLGLGSDFDGISCELEMENAGQLGKLAREMERAGFTDGEMEAVFSGNARRVFREVLR